MQRDLDEVKLGFDRSLNNIFVRSWFRTLFRFFMDMSVDPTLISFMNFIKVLSLDMILLG